MLITDSLWHYRNSSHIKKNPDELMIRYVLHQLLSKPQRNYFKTLCYNSLHGSQAVSQYHCEVQHNRSSKDHFFLETSKDSRAETQQCHYCHVSNACLQVGEAWQEGRATLNFSGQAAKHTAFPTRITAGVCNRTTSCAVRPQQQRRSTSRLQGGPQHYWWSLTIQS